MSIISNIDPTSDKRWDTFVRSHQNGSIYHLSAWSEVLKKTFKHIPFYLAIESYDRKSLSGIIPLMLVKSCFTGKRLVSLPFTSYCTPLFPVDKMQEIIDFSLLAHPNISYFECRFFENATVGSDWKLQCESNHVTSILDIESEVDDLYNKFHVTSVRQRIKRAEKNGLKFRTIDTENRFKLFYHLWLGIRRRHGLPPQPYSFFKNMWFVLKPLNLMSVPCIEYNGEVIAAAVILHFNRKYYLEYMATDYNYIKLCPNQMLIWEVIKLAKENNATTFDFGRSAILNKNLIEFKSRWGARTEKLSYYYFPEVKHRKLSRNTLEGALNRINKIMPPFFLKLEGHIIYPHLS